MSNPALESQTASRPRKHADSNVLIEPGNGAGQPGTRKNGRLFATIGYEGITIDEYINKLTENDVRLLVDVRKNPLSRKYGFSKTRLSGLLGDVGIDYEHFPQLGIASEERKNLKTPQDYENLFSRYQKTVIREEQSAIARLYEAYRQYKRIAITCFEACHTKCHRHKVAEAVETAAAGENLQVVHL